MLRNDIDNEDVERAHCLYQTAISYLMNRQPSRAPSPTPTAFSGISNYRNDSYRPIRDRNAPAVPTIDYRLVSRTHFNELSRYLAAYLARGLSTFLPFTPYDSPYVDQ